MNICVFGASSSKINQKYIEKTEKLGEALAKAGHSLVFGAGTEGLMGAAARGIKKAGGYTVGVIPKFFKEENLSDIFNCDELIFTDSMHERKKKMEELADAFIITPGGIGTFEEFFEVLTLKQLGRHNKAIVIYDAEGYYSNLEKFMQNALDEKFINANTKQLYKTCKTLDEVIKYIEEKPKRGFSVKEMRNY